MCQTLDAYSELCVARHSAFSWRTASLCRTSPFKSSSLLFSVHSVQFLFHTRGAPVMRYRRICAVDRSCYSVVQHKIQQNKTSLVQSPHTTLGQETRWAYSIQRASEPTRDDRWFDLLRSALTTGLTALRCRQIAQRCRCAIVCATLSIAQSPSSSSSCVASTTMGA